MDKDILKLDLELYKKFKRVSIAEFFEKNRHLLGFENLKKALLIAVKELVDNSLDACEEAKILPDIEIEIKQVKPSIYKIKVEDNGPGIPYEKVPEIFGSFLFGSKFHRYVSTRGKQGIGASAVILYSQLTTGQPAEIITRVPGASKAIYHKIKIDVKTNTPEILERKYIGWHRKHGTSVEVTLKAVYLKGKQSVDEYIQLTALANPHANIVYITPKGERIIYKRVTNKVPILYETKPHPHGIEIGVLERMLRDTTYNDLKTFLIKEFSSVGEKTALEILNKANLDPNRDPKSLKFEEIERLYNSMQNTKVRSISAKYITTLGKDTMIESLSKMFDPEFITAVSRKPAVYRGIPFVVEVGLAYGEPIEEFRVFRFANRVPLLYRSGECAITYAIKEIDWKKYGLEGKKGETPNEPLIVMVHVASVWIPFTSESKEAIAPYPEIVKEIKLALKEALRDLAIYVKKKASLNYISDKYKNLYGYGLELSKYLAKILNKNEEEVKNKIISRVKKELYSDVIAILQTVKETKMMIKEGKIEEAKKSIRKMLEDVVKSNIFTKNEVESVIEKAIAEVKTKNI